MVALNLLPLGTLGAVEANGVVSFGLWLPWVSAADGNAVAVKIIHEDDQFLQDVPPREFVLTHSVRGPYGDFWSGTLPIAGTAPAVPGSAWGTPGRYVYRYSIRNPNVGTLDWIIDPFAREFGVGKLSAFTLGYQPYVWKASEAQWRTPALSDLMLYEIDIAEFGGNLERVRNVIAYLKDLGVNGIEIMPLSNVGSSVDWGYLPIGYFGVDERFGKRSDFQALVDMCHQHGIAVIVDVVYGHTGVDFPYYDAYTRLQYRDNPFMGPFAKDYFSNFGKSTDYNRQLTRDYFFTVNHHWLDTYHVDGFRYDCVQTTGTARWASATPASFTRRINSPRLRLRRGNLIGSASTPVPARRSRWCRWPSNSRIPKASCARVIPTAPGRIAPLTRRAALGAVIAAGFLTSACALVCSVIRIRKPPTAT